MLSSFSFALLGPASPSRASPDAASRFSANGPGSGLVLSSISVLPPESADGVVNTIMPESTRP